MRAWMVLLVIGVQWQFLCAVPAIAQESEMKAAFEKFVEFRKAGNYRQASIHAQKALQYGKNFLGPDHKTTALLQNNLAIIYEKLGRYKDAETLYLRALKTNLKVHGPAHPSIGILNSNLAELYRASGRYDEAEVLFKKALGISQKALGPDHLNVSTNLNNLAVLYDDQGRFSEAEKLHRRSLTIREARLGRTHRDVARSLDNLASVLSAQGKYREAEQTFKRALAIREKVLKRHHPDVATTLNNLAVLYEDLGRYREAEPLYKRALLIREQAFGPRHRSVATVLANLAVLYDHQGRQGDAEKFYKRALTINEKKLGAKHPKLAFTLNGLAVLYEAQKRYAEAEELLKRALAIRIKSLGPKHPGVATSLNNLAGLYQEQKRYFKAEPLYQRALSIREKLFGPAHAKVGNSLNNLAVLYRVMGRDKEALPLYRRAIAIQEKTLGPDHPAVSNSQNNLASLYFSQRDWGRATAHWRKATEQIKRRARRLRGARSTDLTGRQKSESFQNGWYYRGLIKSIYRINKPAAQRDKALENETFTAAQWSLSSSAARALAKMAVRGAKKDPVLAKITRARQDLVAEWKKRDQARTTALALAPRRRNARAEAQNITRMGAIDRQLALIDKQLAVQFPNYAAFADPEPLTIAQVQELLKSDEALVLFFDTLTAKPAPEETFIWVVTRTASRWVRIAKGTSALRRDVGALRCGLDRDGAWATSQKSLFCKLMLARFSQPAANEQLPFDLARAHQLYRDLFGQIEDLIKGKTLLVVPTGPLTKLPFQVLVTQQAKSATRGARSDYGKVSWLTRAHAIAVLPSVASLKSLRLAPRNSKAKAPFIGFGNPLLQGSKQLYQQALQKRDCRRGTARQLAIVGQRLKTAVNFGGVFRRGSQFADVATIRNQIALPETADELCAIAQTTGAAAAVYLAGQANETRLKALSADGSLANARIVQFATHGLLASEARFLGVSNAEPGLILTPPETASARDDGYLTASEITELKLDADWVILSACNTAGGSAIENAEALSGLARAFFYAGARSLLVSHWYVNSRAAVDLTTGALAALKSDKAIGRSEALRRSMAVLIERGGRQAHPSYWAPFVVVGSGGR